ncbi:MAG: outer membrane beta-barrel protein [Pyrinomonadaceae bacterium]|nr:outer membrane beta-barrel protein [Pyrinomonadaceae bacterium]
MIKKAMVLATLFVAFSVCSQQALAQSDEKKIEIGGQLSLLRVPTLTVRSTGIVCVTIPCPTTAFSQGSEIDPGFGARIGFNVAPYLTLEAEGNLFPRDRDREGGRKAQGLFGAKVGKRFDKAGVFAKARPGFVRFSRGDYHFGPGGCIAVFPPPIACFQPVAKTNFALDLGGVVEFYPSSNTILRFDAGDTMIRFRSRNAPALSTTGITGLVVVPVAGETKHNLQVSAGVGFRF